VASDRSVISPCTPVSSTNKTDHHDITEILLKVALSTITLTDPRNHDLVNRYVIYVSQTTTYTLRLL
jgi:hypothetical protein